MLPHHDYSIFELNPQRLQLVHLSVIVDRPAIDFALEIPQAAAAKIYNINSESTDDVAQDGPPHFPLHDSKTGQA